MSAAPVATAAAFRSSLKGCPPSGHSFSPYGVLCQPVEFISADTLVPSLRASIAQLVCCAVVCCDMPPCVWVPGCWLFRVRSPNAMPQLPTRAVGVCSQLIQERVLPAGHDAPNAKSLA